MVADKGKKAKLSDKGEEDNSEVIDEKLVLSIEKLQEIQDELEKVFIQCFYAISHSLILSAVLYSFLPNPLLIVYQEGQ